MSTEQTQKVAELIKGEGFAFLTTTSPDGTLTSRPMTLQEVEFDGDLWFFAERDSNPVRHVVTSPQVNVGVGSGGSWVSLTGRARVVEDPAKKRDLWNSAVEAWFPEDRTTTTSSCWRSRGFGGVLGQPRWPAGDRLQLRQGQG